MPFTSSESTLARQWEMLKFLPNRSPGITASDLSKRLENYGHKVSKRTVERDLDNLSEIFPIYRNDRSKPYGWYWTSDKSITIPGISLSEAVSLGLLEDLLRQLIPPSFLETLESRFSQAREKLHALSNNSYAKWTDLVRYVPPGIPFQPPVISREIMHTVQEALLQKRQLKVSYTSAGSSAPKELLLHPTALIQQGERSYILAGTFNYLSPVHYAIHRIHHAEIIDEEAKRPESFSLDEFLKEGGAQFGQGKAIQFQAKLSDELATLLRETALSPDQKIVTDSGKNILTATVKNSWLLQFWILSQGPAITILEPPSLRANIIELIKSTLVNYSQD